MKKEIIVWLDVDDVLLDFKMMYNRHLKENYDIKIPHNYIPKTWHYTEILPKKIKFGQTMETLGKRWAKNQKALEGAKDFTKQLKKMGYRVILITHIEGEQGPDRINCLMREGIHFDEIYFTMGRTKSEFAVEVVKRYPKAVNCFMDDKAENVVDFLMNVPKTELGLTLDLPFNDQTFATLPEELRDGRFVAVKTHKDMYKAMLKFLKKHFNN